MTFTWIAALFPIFVVAALRFPLTPYWGVAFFSTFSASAVANLPDIPFGIQLYHVFGLWIVSAEMLRIAQHGSITHLRSFSAPVTFGVLFLLAVVASMLANLGTVNRTNVAQIGHLALGLGTAWAIAVRLARDPSALGQLTRSFIAGAIFASCWGVVQFVLASNGYEYPDYIFNNSAGEFSVGFLAEQESGLPKVSSVATEASFLARCLVVAFSLTLGNSLLRRTRQVPSSFASTVTMSVLLIGLIVCGSATGFIGLVAAVLFAPWTDRRAFNKALAYAGLFAIVLGGALIFDPAFEDAFYEATFGKADTFSFLQRTESIVTGWEQFTQHPVFGWGLGSNTVHDLVVKLLADTGLVGFVAFGALIGSLHTCTQPVLVRSFAVLLLMDALAGWSYTYGHFWLVVGLVLGTCGEGVGLEDPRAASLAGSQV